MKRQYLSTNALAAWAKLNGVEFHGVAVEQLQSKDGIDKGSAVVATEAITAKEFNSEQSEVTPKILMTVPPDVVLSQSLVETCAKSDRHLKEILDSLGDYARTARGAILVFLLLHITYSDPDLYGETAQDHPRVSNPWTEYIKFLPESYSLPTFYTIEEQELLHGTSLEPALEAKMASLEREFDRLRAATLGIPRCNRDWWNEDTGRLSLEDWKIVDAMYRSRALDLPGTGHAMVPCVDMANHASGDDTRALYETDNDGNAVLQLRWGQRLNAGDEVTITYGDEKGASEMIFSYGFLEDSVTSARQLFLDLDIPNDDPLRPAKKVFCNDAPGFRLFTPPGSTSTDWESAFIWWCCVNEEDGLEFRVIQSNDGERELRVAWKDQVLESSDQLENLLKQDDMWHVFQLRAVVIVQDRVTAQLGQLQASEEYVERWKEYVDEKVIRSSVWDTTMKLRRLETEMMKQAVDDLETKKLQLLETPVVTAYLQTQSPGNDIPEDFS